MRKAEDQKEKCGIVMPISAIDGCNDIHWIEVKRIIEDVIKSANFEPNLVSDTEEISIIQKTIIQNLYQNPIVICDVSGKNPNVMFELGMRLAFDKPTVIVKDDQTSYSFDTAPIEHLEYPRDLHFHKIVEFKEKLEKKLITTYKKVIEDPENYSLFLKSFGEFKITKIGTKEVPETEILMDELKIIRKKIATIERFSRLSILSSNNKTQSLADLFESQINTNDVGFTYILQIKFKQPQKEQEIYERLSNIFGPLNPFRMAHMGNGSKNIKFTVQNPLQIDSALLILKTEFKDDEITKFESPDPFGVIKI